jgi:hypothetical protein
MYIAPVPTCTIVKKCEILKEGLPVFIKLLYVTNNVFQKVESEA